MHELIITNNNKLLTITDIALSKSTIDFSKHNNITTIQNIIHKDRATGMTFQNHISILINDQSTKQYKAKSLILLNNNTIIGGITLNNDDTIITKHDHNPITELVNVNTKNINAQTKIEFQNKINGSIYTHNTDSILAVLNSLDTDKLPNTCKCDHDNNDQQDNTTQQLTDEIINELTTRFCTKEELAEFITNNYSKEQIDSIIKNIYTKEELETVLDNYYTKSDVYSKTEVYPKSEVYTTSDVYTKSDVYNRTEVYTKEEVDNIVSNIDTTSFESARVDKLNVKNIEIAQEEVLNRHNTNIKSGVKSATELVSRGTGAPALALSIGDIVFIRCSSQFKTIIGESERVKVGTEFFVSNEDVNNGVAPYIPSSRNGSFIEPTVVSSDSKCFIGAGRYITLTCADLADTSNNSFVLIKKIGYE